MAKEELLAEDPDLSRPASAALVRVLQGDDQLVAPAIAVVRAIPKTAYSRGSASVSATAIAGHFTTPEDL